VGDRTGPPLDEDPAHTDVADTGPPPDAPVDRDAVVTELASEILTAAAAGETWRPDYSALMYRTGYRRSWCEKAVRDARRAALGGNSGTRTAGAPTEGQARTARARTEAREELAGVTS
jgi:hypothetical protein